MAVIAARNAELRNAGLDAERRVARRTERNVRYFAAHIDQIDGRLTELDREWDIERAMDLQAAALGAASAVFSLTRGRHWLLVPIAIAGFLGQHAVLGHSAPRRLMRRLGYRTRIELETERYALRALRGDFGELSKESADAALKTPAPA